MPADLLTRRRAFLTRVPIESVDSVVERILDAARRADDSERRAGFSLKSAFRFDRAFLSKLVRVARFCDDPNVETSREFSFALRSRRAVAFFAVAFLASNGFARFVRVRSDFPTGSAADLHAVASAGGFLPSRTVRRAIYWNSPVGESVVAFDESPFVYLGGTRLNVGRDVEPTFEMTDALKTRTKETFR